MTTAELVSRMDEREPRMADTEDRLRRTMETIVQRQLLWPLGDNYFGRFRCDLDRCREYGDGLTSLWTARAPSTGS